MDKQKIHPKYYKFLNSPNGRGSVEWYSGSAFSLNKIYKINNPENLNLHSNFIDNTGTLNGFSSSNHKYFEPSTEEEYCIQEGIPFVNKDQKKSENYDYLKELFKKYNIQ